MIVLFACSICGIAAFCIAIILQFSIPSWRFFSGLSRIKTSDLKNIDVQRLRRSLSILMYLLSALFFAGAILFYIKSISYALLLPMLHCAILLVFNGFWFFYRQFDHNKYPARVRKAALVFWISANVVFLLPLIFYIL